MGRHRRRRQGASRHFARNAEPPAPGLIAAISHTAGDVRRLEPALAPLLPVSDETLGDEQSGYVRVLTAWAGPDGALFHIRDRSVGAFPEGFPPPRHVRVALDIPHWFRRGPLRDLLTGEVVAEVRPGRTAVTLSGLRGFRLLWADADPARPLARIVPVALHEGEKP